MEESKIALELHTLNEKLDRYVRIEEYRIDMKRMELQQEKLDSKLDKAAEYGFKEHSDMRREAQERFDKLSEELDNARVGIWQYIASTAVGFIFGGGMIGLLVAIGAIK